MNVSEMKAYIGKTGQWRPYKTSEKSDIAYDVRILDASFEYGRLRLHIKPVSGKGTALVQASQVDVPGIPTPSPTYGAKA